MHILNCSTQTIHENFGLFLLENMFRAETYQWALEQALVSKTDQTQNSYGWGRGLTGATLPWIRNLGVISESWWPCGQTSGVFTTGYRMSSSLLAALMLASSGKNTSGGFPVEDTPAQTIADSGFWVRSIFRMYSWRNWNVVWWVLKPPWYYLLHLEYWTIVYPHEQLLQAVWRRLEHHFFCVHRAEAFATNWHQI